MSKDHNQAHEECAPGRTVSLSIHKLRLWGLNLPFFDFPHLSNPKYSMYVISKNILYYMLAGLYDKTR